MRYRILVVMGKGPRNYSAYAPEVPGCVATGKTAEETLRAVTGWGRFAEAFAYDDETQTFSLENPT